MFLSAAAEIPSIEPTSVIVGTLGGLALFLYGMHKMSDGLKAVAGDSMKALLSRLTTNRFLGAITGALVTAVLQSSSITTVLSVGFVSAGLMTLSQTVGVIMGANVGTTITAQMLAFDIDEWAWLMIALGFASWSFGRRDVTRDVGTMLMGFGMLFIGMEQMGSATSPLRSYQPFIDLMAGMDRIALGMLAGACFTALVQSSSATIGIVIMLASQGHISLEAGIALGIGAKIGTCVTALLAGLGKPAEARQVGVVHVLFNVFGALLWLPFIDQLATMAEAVSPGHPELSGTERLAEETPRQIANAITIFAAANLSVFIWFTPLFARVARKLVPEGAAAAPEAVKPLYLDPVFLGTPALALNQIRLELVHLGGLVEEMVEETPVAVFEGSHEALDRVVKMDDDVDHLHEGILDYIAALTREEMKTSETRRLEGEIEIANNLEAIGDLLETNLVAQGRRRIDQGLAQPGKGPREFQDLYHAVVEAMKDTLDLLARDDEELARNLISRKEHIRELAVSAGEAAALELISGTPDRIARFRIESDIIDQVKRLFYHMRRIAKVVAGERN